jgi:subtilisin
MTGRCVRAGLGLLVVSFVPLSAHAAGDIPEELVTKAFSRGRVRVLVTMKAGWQPEGGLSAARASSQRAAIARTADEVSRGLRAAGATVLRRFDRLPHLVAEVSPAGLAELAASPMVEAVHEDVAYPVALSASSPLVQADQGWSWGRTGSGQTVAVLDTGIRASHSFFGGRVVGQACFSTTSAGLSVSNCPSGSDTQIGGNAAAACTYTGDCFHGTHVAGIAAGSSASFSGVGRAAGIYAIQVFSRFNDPAQCSPSPAPCTMSFTSDQIDALNHVFAQRGSYNFASVNMSLGGGQFSSFCDSQPHKAAIDQLRSVGIATVIASGNDGFRTSISAPACISSAISVGSTTKTNVVSSFSNAASFMSLWAPGGSINSATTATDTAFGVSSGTSMAAPHVAGAWAVLKHHKPAASVSEILSALDSTGLSITDTRSGGSVTKRRISVMQALRSLCVPAGIERNTSPGGSLATNDCRAWRRDTYADSYNFSVTAGEQVAFVLASTQLNTYLQILDANGNVVAQDDNGAGGTNARIPAGGGFFSMPGSGTYTVQAMAASPNVVGAYTLTYAIPPTATPTPAPTHTPTPTPVPTPARPTLLSPNGTVTIANPTYTWNAVAGAVDYQIWVGDAQTAVINTWHAGSAVCSGATCSITPATSLANGGYTWWILARNAWGNGPWSAGMAFTVSASTPTPTPATGGPPTKPTLVSPNGTAGTTTPTYTWNAVSNATDYQLWVGDASIPVINTSHAASAVCSGTTCSVTPSTALANGGSAFWIQARNGAGAVWSDAMSFTVNAGAPTATPTPTPPAGGPPAKPTLVAPNGTATTSRPTYTWNAAANATDYQLWVGDASTPIINTSHAASAVCSGATCSVTPSTALANGGYSFWVQARNTAGSVWSNAMGFTVNAGAPPGAATLLSPSGTIGTSTPAYTWNVVAGATEYQIWVGDASTPVIQTWYQASTVCSGSTCSVTPSTPLASGGYTWWIQTRGPTGTGSWSAGMSFVR